MINIDPSGDVVVRVTEVIRNDRGEQTSSQTEAFRVRRQIMRQASAPWWEVFNPNSTYGEGVKDFIEFDEVPIFSFELLLRELHHNTQAPQIRDTSMLNVW